MADVTYSIDELERLTGIKARTIRFYVEKGLLPAPEFRGRYTTYGPVHLNRLQRIRADREARFTLDQIAARLAAIGRVAPRSGSGSRPGGIAAKWAMHARETRYEVPLEGTHRVEEPRAAYGCLSMPPSEPEREKASAPRRPVATDGTVALHWRRYELAPGLEVHLASRSSPDARDLALELLEGRLDAKQYTDLERFVAFSD